MKKTLYSSAFALTLLLSSCGLIQHTSQGGNDGLQKEATAEVASAVEKDGKGSARPFGPSATDWIWA